MHALGTMSQVPRNLTPINPFHSKDDLQFEFAFRFTKQEVHRLLPCLHITPVVTVQKVGLVDGYIFLLVQIAISQILYCCSYPNKPSQLLQA